MNTQDILCGLFYLAIIIPSLVIMARNTVITRPWEILIVSKWDDYRYTIKGDYPIAWGEEEVIADVEESLKKAEPSYFAGMAWRN